MQNPQPGFRAGDRVRVRRRHWTVTGCTHFDECGLVSLRALGPDGPAVTQQVIWPFDRIEPVAIPSTPKRTTIRQWRAACRAMLAQHGTPASLVSAAAAQIELLPHQLEPALAVLHGRSCRLLIGDEVGLGKTIQAALIVAELIARHAADRVLILTPAHLRDQWAGELSNRFALAAHSVDATAMIRRLSELPVGTNPWTTWPLAIASLDYVKRAEILPAIAAVRWDAVVVDEAHGATPGSDRAAAVQILCERAAYVVLVTATPHSGDRRAFLSLCGLGGSGPHRGDELLLFRRARTDVRLGAVRRIHRLPIAPSAAERRMHAALAALTRAVELQGAPGPTGDGVGSKTWLALGVLHKRAQSSAYSLAQSIRRRLAFVRTAASTAVSTQLLLPLDDSEGECNAADDAPDPTTPLLADTTAEEALLERLLDAAEAACSHESKASRLRRLLDRLAARGERAIVFTEYRDTLLHLRQVLARDCAILHGGLARDERKAALESFLTGRAPLLLTTDAAGEGLNLQQSCRVVINLELPWNPMRLEQRVGRVDRIGQTRAVHVFHLIAQGTRETALLERLAVRIANAQADIGAANPLGPIALGAGGGAPVAKGAEETGVAVPAPVRFVEEGEAELRRLRQQRALVRRTIRHTNRVELLDAATTISRSRRLRPRFPASDILLLVQSVFVDGGGRLAASHVTALLYVIGASGARQHTSQGAAAAELLRRIQSGATLPDADLEQWRHTCVSQHQAFWSTRLRREVANARAAEPAGMLQPGLFDHRAERLTTDRLERDADRSRAIARWIAAAEHALTAAHVEIRYVSALLLR